MEIEIYHAKWEYVCADCRQFRLYLKDSEAPEVCGNCGSSNIFVAPFQSIAIRD